MLIILSVSVCLYLLHFEQIEPTARWVGTIAIVGVLLIWLAVEYYKSRNRHVVIDIETPIRRFVLMTNNGDREKEWCCEGVKSFLIGKSTANTEVDIELDDNHYSEYISDEHAVLNHSSGFWYIEDLDSQNGVGIKKKGEKYALRLKPMVAYKIDEGDIIYISKAKILVR